MKYSTIKNLYNLPKENKQNIITQIKKTIFDECKKHREDKIKVGNYFMSNPLYCEILDVYGDKVTIHCEVHGRVTMSRKMFLSVYNF